MRCKEVQEHLSFHLDHALEPDVRRVVESHVGDCADCDSHFRSLKQSQALLMAIGRRPAPADLALKIKVAVSNQRQVSFGRQIQGVLTHLDNACKAFMLPATVGLVTAVVFFGLFVGFFVQPPSVSASNDIPTLLYTPPRLVSASFYGAESTLKSPVVIEAFVNAQGRVEDYNVISGDDNPDIRKQLDRSLLFAVFEPATAFGQPAAGRVVISFTNVDVQG